MYEYMCPRRDMIAVECFLLAYFFVFIIKMHGPKNKKELDIYLRANYAKQRIKTAPKR